MWNRMEVFYHVVKAGSFTKAVNVLNKSQNALSTSVATLEHRLNCQLLHRGVKGLVLTRKGEEVFQTAERMVMDMQGLRTVLNDKKGVEGKIRISTTYVIANYVISKHLLDFNKKYPNIILEVICSDSLIDIVRNEVDIIITPEPQKSSWVIQELLYTIKADLYASPIYIKKHGIPKTLEDLDNHRLLSYLVQGNHLYFDEWHLTAGRFEKSPREAVMKANSIEFLIEAAEEGIGIISSYDNMSIINKSSLIKVNPNLHGPKREIYLTYSTRSKNIEKIETLTNHLIENLSDK